MRRGGRRLSSAGAVLAALFLFLCAAGAFAQDEELPSDASVDDASIAAAQAGCANEIGLFCRGESGAAMIDCLSAYRGNATARCAAALRARDSLSPSVKTWSSPAYAWVDAPGSSKSFGPDAGELPVGQGFDFTMADRVKSYELGGPGARELLDQLSAKGLRFGSDGGAAEPASSALSFDYESEPGSGGCAVASAHVRLEIDESYPLGGGDGRWPRLESALRARASARKKTAERAGREFLRRLQTLPRQPDCAAVDAAVRGLYRRAGQDGQQGGAYDAQSSRERAPRGAADVARSRDPR